jgi:hypothetical protein
LTIAHVRIYETDDRSSKEFRRKSWIETMSSFVTWLLGSISRLDFG